MKTAVAISRAVDARSAAQDVATQVVDGLGVQPDALIIFAAPSFAHADLLQEIGKAFPDCLVVGSSSAGEFMNGDQGAGAVCAIGLSGTDARFSVAVGPGVRQDPAAAAKKIVSGFKGLAEHDFPYRSALVMTDALAGHAEILVEELTVGTAGQYQFFGGGAGDNAEFRQTTVFCGHEVLSDAAVALEILSRKPIGIGVQHGWEPASIAYRVTEADGMRLISLNGLPAAEAFEAHAETTAQNLDKGAPIPFFLHNILGIDTGAGYRLRVPLAIQDDGSVLCAAEVPQESVVRIMRSSPVSAMQAAKHATQSALAALGDHKPQAAIFFDCVATRLRLGHHFQEEVATVRSELSGAAMVGCNTHGQIARAEGQFGGFHNCTAVVAVFPE